jgi:hypothetical protein
VKRFRQWYGSSPLHLVAMAGSFALAWYAGSRLLSESSSAVRVLIWIAGAAVVHDLVLFPLYSTADRALQTILPKRPARRPAYINYLRFPAALSAVLFVVWLPLILNLVAAYPTTTALDESVFLPRWILVTAALFTASALVLAVRLLGARCRALLIERRAKRRAADDRKTR